MNRTTDLLPSSVGPAWPLIYTSNGTPRNRQGEQFSCYSGDQHRHHQPCHRPLEGGSYENPVANRAVGSIKPNTNVDTAPTVVTRTPPVRKALVIGIDRY